MNEPRAGQDVDIGGSWEMGTQQPSALSLQFFYKSKVI